MLGCALNPQSTNRVTDGEPQPLLVFDDASAKPAVALADALCLSAAPIGSLSTDSIARQSTLVAFLDLKDQESVETFRRAAGKPPKDRLWAFVVPSGFARHAAEVQANALGASVHLGRDTCEAELKKLLSMAHSAPLTAAARHELKTKAGGASIIAATGALSELFSGLSDGQPLRSEGLSEIGIAAAQSVGDVGTEAWLDSVRSYHHGTFQHCLLVTGTAAGFASRQRLDKANAVRLTTAALLHDIGKAAIPVHILDKPGKLTEQEFSVIKTHPTVARTHLDKMSGIDPAVVDAVTHHHEALDGSGYPDRLRGNQISMLTRILTVCDVYAALVEARSYRPARPPEEAITILVKMALEGKVDYQVVRGLAQVFGMDPPKTIAEVEANMDQLRVA